MKKSKFSEERITYALERSKAAGLPPTSVGRWA